MLKKEFISNIYEAIDGEVTKKDIEVVLKGIDDATLDAIAHNDCVPFGFGRVGGKHRDARTGRNPATGESLDIPAKDGVPYFKASAKAKA